MTNLKFVTVAVLLVSLFHNSHQQFGNWGDNSLLKQWLPIASGESGESPSNYAQAGFQEAKGYAHPAPQPYRPAPPPPKPYKPAPAPAYHPKPAPAKPAYPANSIYGPHHGHHHEHHHHAPHYEHPAPAKPAYPAPHPHPAPAYPAPHPHPHPAPAYPAPHPHPHPAPAYPAPHDHHHHHAPGPPGALAGFPIQQNGISNTGEHIIENLIGGIPFDCHTRPTGHWRDPRYCDIFHACVYGVQRKTYSCPVVGERSFFDEHTRRCEFLRNSPNACAGAVFFH